MASTVRSGMLCNNICLAGPITFLKIDRFGRFWAFWLTLDQNFFRLWRITIIKSIIQTGSITKHS
jgi:hypothetical protein